jgi:hypothetical protein
MFSATQFPFCCGQKQNYFYSKRFGTDFVDLQPLLLTNIHPYVRINNYHSVHYCQGCVFVWRNFVSKTIPEIYHIDSWISAIHCYSISTVRLAIHTLYVYLIFLTKHIGCNIWFAVQTQMKQLIIYQ